MITKILTLIGNVFKASVLVILASTQHAAAQESGQLSIQLSGSGSISATGLLSIAPNQVDFGAVELGQTVTKTFVISNQGPVSGEVVDIREADLFGGSTSEFSSTFNGFTTIAGQDAINAQVTFSPTTPGDKSAGLRLSINGSTTPYVVLFTGKGRYPLSSELTKSVQKVEFGEVLQNSYAAKTLVLANNGAEGSPSIAVSGIEKSGTNANEFNVNMTPTTLEPGQSMDVQIEMNTSVETYKNMQLEVLHDGVNASLNIAVTGSVITPNTVPVNFTLYNVNAPAISEPTTLQFGPDKKLYVGTREGDIHVLNVTKGGGSQPYSAVIEETINLIKNVPNRNDDGKPNPNVFSRLLTGIFVTGSAANPVIYAASSDPRMGGGGKKSEWDGDSANNIPPNHEKLANGNDTDLDTNSGILHKLTRSNGNWTKQDLVRGLPRSEENHAPNGLVLLNNKIYLNIGGHTNQGALSYNFAKLPEYALSAATLEIDLSALPSIPYDLPTLNGPADQYDPFGGHDGENMAKLVEDGPVQIYASGLRNAYDLVLTESGNFYTWDNGPNAPWGGEPGPNCSDDYVQDNTGIYNKDSLHKLTKGYYAGHPNPTRGSKSNTFGGESPIEGAANPIECEYRASGDGNGALATDSESLNGIAEYSASNFANAMKGDLLSTGYKGALHRFQLNSAGTAVISRSKLWQMPSPALDITTQGDGDQFPGTIWAGIYAENRLVVLEPND